MSFKPVAVYPISAFTSKFTDEFSQKLSLVELITIFLSAQAALITNAGYDDSMNVETVVYSGGTVLKNDEQFFDPCNSESAGTFSLVLDGSTTVPADIDTTLTVFPSKRGGKNIAYLGHIFNFFHQSSKTIKWRCMNRKNLKCPSVLTTSLEYNLITVIAEHTHPPDHDKVRSTVLTRKMYDASLEDPNKKPAELVEQFLNK
uniref:FLYWCH-type domain-containing protein n=2 Tax=Steinernema glaseri TaxID=37863 RepID=A0A1I7Y9C1_9BILA